MVVYFDIENTMLVSFDIKFIRQGQKQRRNGETCRVSRTCRRTVEPDKFDVRRL